MTEFLAGIVLVLLLVGVKVLGVLGTLVGITIMAETMIIGAILGVIAIHAVRGWIFIAKVLVSNGEERTKNPRRI